MTQHIKAIIQIEPNEFALLSDLVARLEHSDLGDHPFIEVLRNLSHQIGAGKIPIAEMGIYGGVLQWCRGNVLPISVYDYDGDDDELADRDPEGNPCTHMHFKPIRMTSNLGASKPIAATAEELDDT